MANLLIEGFDWFPSSQGTTERIALLGANSWYEITKPAFTQYYPDVTTGRFGFGKALAVQPATNQQVGYVITLPVGTAAQTSFMGFSIYIDESTTGAPAFYFYDAVTNAPQLTFTFSPNGTVRLYRGNSTTGTLLATSKAGVWQNNTWFNVEAKAYIHGTDGTFELRINTEQVIQLSAGDTQNTTNTYIDSVGFNCPPTSTTHFNFLWDDLFVNDDTGSENSDWSGNLRVKGQFMIANGATNQFSIGGSAPAATNWQSVLNNLLDDTKYVYDTVVGHQDLYTPDPNLNAPIVRCVQIRLALRQDDATQRSAKALLRLGTSIYVGLTEFFTNQTYTFYKERWQLNPATGVSFTGAEVNAAQVGVELVS